MTPAISCCNHHSKTFLYKSLILRLLRACGGMSVYNHFADRSRQNVGSRKQSNNPMHFCHVVPEGPSACYNITMDTV